MALVAVRKSPYPPQAPQIHGEQQTNSALKGRKNSQQAHQEVTPADQEESRKNPEEANGEEAELTAWPVANTPVAGGTRKSRSISNQRKLSRSAGICAVSGAARMPARPQ
jgi:hypothetical protein